MSRMRWLVNRQDSRGQEFGEGSGPVDSASSERPPMFKAGPDKETGLWPSEVKEVRERTMRSLDREADAWLRGKREKVGKRGQNKGILFTYARGEE